MTDARSLYTFNPGPWASVQGRDAIMLHLLGGFVDAGNVIRLLSEQILAQCEHEVVAEFDVDALHDYRARRPAMTFDTDRWTQADMPELILHRCTDLAGRDFLLLAGQEPDNQWVRAIESMLQVAEGLGVSQLVTVGGVPMGLPHTRPLMLTSHASREDLTAPNPIFIDRVVVPGSFSALLEFRAGERGMDARGWVVHVPHYLAQGSFAPAALRLGQTLQETLGLQLPLAEIAETAESTMAALQVELDGDPELAQLVAGLEQTYDELRSRGESVPNTDEIGRALERFLSEYDGGSSS